MPSEYVTSKHEVVGSNPGRQTGHGLVFDPVCLPPDQVHHFYSMIEVGLSDCGILNITRKHHDYSINLIVV